MLAKSMIGWAERAATTLAALSLAGVTVVTAASVMLRALSLNFPDAIDFASLFMAIAVFWGMVSAVLRGELIAVNFLAQALSPTLQHRLAATASAVTCIFLALMAYAGLLQLERVINSGEVTPELRVPLWPFLALAVAGLTAVAGAALIRFVRPNPLDPDGTTNE